MAITSSRILHSATVWAAVEVISVPEVKRYLNDVFNALLRLS
jgi:hypothetical protein